MSTPTSTIEPLYRMTQIPCFFNTSIIIFRTGRPLTRPHSPGCMNANPNSISPGSFNEMPMLPLGSVAVGVSSNVIFSKVPFPSNLYGFSAIVFPLLSRKERKTVLVPLLDLMRSIPSYGWFATRCIPCLLSPAFEIPTSPCLHPPCFFYIVTFSKQNVKIFSPCNAQSQGV